MIAKWIEYFNHDRIREKMQLRRCVREKERERERERMWTTLLISTTKIEPNGLDRGAIEYLYSLERME